MAVAGEGFKRRSSICKLIAAAHLDPDDVAIGISQQGSTKDIVTAMQAANKSGAKTICITGHGKSPITEVSDISLVCMNRGIRANGADDVREIKRTVDLPIIAINKLPDKRGVRIITPDFESARDLAEAESKNWRNSIKRKIYRERKPASAD